jgi:hypothetical protein
VDKLLDKYAGTDKEIQLKLRGDLAMVQGIGGLGPGKITRSEIPGIYKLEQQAQMQTPSGPRVVTMPFLFAAKDVLWISEGPEKTEESQIVSPVESGISIPSA